MCHVPWLVLGLFGISCCVRAAEQSETKSLGVVSLALSTDGARLASAHDVVQSVHFHGSYRYPPQEVVVWRVKSLYPLTLVRGLSFNMPSNQWTRPLVSFDGNDVLVSSGAGLAKCLAVQSSVIPLLTSNTLVLSHDHRMVARFSRPDGGIRLLELKSGATIGAIPHNVTYGRLWEFSKDSKFLALGESGKPLVRIWSLESHRQHSKIQTPGIGSLAISPDSQHVAGTNLDGNWVILWDLHTGKEKGRFDARMHARGVRFSPDGRLVAVFGEAARWGVCEMRQVADLHLIERFVDKSAFSISAILFSQNGRILVTGTQSGSIGSHLLDRETLRAN